MQMSKPTILALIPYKIFPAMMGGQKGIALFYKYLSIQSNLYAVTTEKNESSEDYPVYNVLTNKSSRYINPRVYFVMKKYAEKHAATHLLFEHPYYAWLIALFKLLTSYKIIVHSHNIESERFKSVGKWWWKILWYYERFAYKKADYVWFKTNEDRNYAVANYKLSIDKTHIVPYGIEADALPTEKEVADANLQVKNIYEIPLSSKILLFNGTLNYKPNLDALYHILDDINPLLMEKHLDYKIIICGKNLPLEMKELKEYKDKNIIYAGFVEDIDLYFKACDVFLNPLLDGGGIKTKLVEALGFGKPSISSENGAIGILAECTSGRLDIIKDNDWQAFANAIENKMNNTILNDNQSFYDIFSWSTIAKNVVKSL